ncbi:MAG: NigD-like protein [Proteiniphilum sp.]|jgi:hypothetical protein|nr:NigD-like protein [Proteiniphilum sp.]
MKKTVLTYSFVLIGLLLIMPSCDDNSKSLGSFRINIATVIPEDQNAYSLLLDDGTHLWPAASDVRYAPKNNQRVFLNYTILSEKQGEYDHYIKVNDIWNILTKQAIELNAQNEDSIGNDPVKAKAVWVGGDYLNVSFMFNYGGVKPHAINLVKNTLSDEASPDAIDLEFRHNSYQSAQTRFYEGFICFDLKPFRVDDADSVNLSIKVKEWSGETTYDVVYRYNQPAMEATTRMPIPVISSNEYY